MFKKLLLLCLASSLLFIACTDVTEYDSLDALPVSNLEYTEIIDGVSTTQVYTDSALYRFEDHRELDSNECNFMQTRVTMIEERETFSRTFALIIRTLVNNSDLQDNNILYENAADYELHLGQEPYDLIDLLNPCDLAENRTSLYLGYVEFQNPLLTTTVFDSGDIRKYELNTVVINDLGYIIIDAEFDYTASRISNVTGSPVNENIQVEAKIKHAIRFPEIDK